jgi:hypothetical protein
MKIGTKSVLFGAHCFFLHPWFVAWGWWKLYGFPLDPRLWVAFAVHDFGYIGKPNMDGAEGETHVEFGARVMGFLFGKAWGDFSRYHSRFYAKKDGLTPSRLCIADKLAITLTPAWLYLPMVNWTGEIKEYMAMSVQNGNTKYAFMAIDHKSQRQWYANMQAYLVKWVAEHKDGRADTWTPAQREARDSTGVWQ